MKPMIDAPADVPGKTRLLVRRLMAFRSLKAPAALQTSRMLKDSPEQAKQFEASGIDLFAKLCDPANELRGIQR